MPNWCAGNIRFRGKMDDIMKLLREKLEYCIVVSDENGIHNETKNADVDIDESLDEVFVTSPYDSASRSWCHIKDTHRNFLDLNGSTPYFYSVMTFVHDKNDEAKYPSTDNHLKDIVIFDNFSAAWDYDPAPYVQMSKDYNVDIAIHGWEQGIGFSHSTYIVGGELVQDTTFSVSHYSEWVWESELPYVGG